MVELPFAHAIAAVILLVAFGVTLLVSLLLPWRGFAAWSLLLGIANLWGWCFTDTPAAAMALVSTGCIAAMLPAFVVKGIAAGRLNRRPAPLRLGLALAALHLGAPLVVELARHASAAHGLPAAFAGTDLVYRPRALLQSCEIRIWRHASIAGLSAADWQALPLDLLRRGATPYPADADALSAQDQWLRGLGCSKAPPEDRAAIVQALNEPGAYFATDGRSGLVAMPARGWLVQARAGSSGD